MKALIEGIKRGAKLTPGDRRKINAALVKAGLDGNGSFREVGEAISTIFDILGKNGIEQDEVLNAQRYSGDKGQNNVALAFKTDDPFSPMPIGNSMLALSWHKRESGNYEVLAYLS